VRKQQRAVYIVSRILVGAGALAGRISEHKRVSLLEQKTRALSRAAAREKTTRWRHMAGMMCIKRRCIAALRAIRCSGIYACNITMRAAYEKYRQRAYAAR